MSNLTEQEINGLLLKSDELILVNKEKERMYKSLEDKIKLFSDEVKALSIELDAHISASSLIGTVSDTSMKQTLGVITGVINQALSIIFPADPRRVEIEHTLFRKKTPHFNVTLFTGSGDEEEKRSFKQSGTGLAQVVSFLFTISLIDARKGRPLIVIDELLNGLHPDAKYLIKELITALTDRYQFIMVEYGLDIGKEYHVHKVGKIATVKEYPNNTYYMDLNKKLLRQAQLETQADPEEIKNKALESYNAIQ